MVKKLYIDIETFSSVNLKESGAYKYMESIDFEILMIAYAFDQDSVQIIDLAKGETIPDKFLKILHDPKTEKHAHNATFERNAFRTYGHDIPVNQWRCTAIKAAYCGLPLALGMVSKALKLEEKGKSETGKALIKHFCIPVKPTKVNGMRERNFYFHDPEKWEEFKEYCVQDVEAEREIDNRLSKYLFPRFEKLNYLLDQKINDKGILVDLKMAKSAYEIDIKFSSEIREKVKELTGVENPNSPAQLRNWLGGQMQKEVTTLAKDTLDDLIKEAGPGPVTEVLNYRKKLSKSSTKKYISMLNCAGEDSRIRGLFQFYGANRTGRWAGRLVQMQNLPRNYLKDLEEARELISSGDYDLITLLYDDVSKVLSELIRTAFIAKKDHMFVVADFSAIEARVLSWLAGETWREEVFRSHGKIYEASASMMFNVPIEEITKGSKLREQGKTAELALGYQGSVGAMEQMGGEKMGISQSGMKMIVDKWRRLNPKIVKLWYAMDSCARRSVRKKCKIISKFKGIEFDCSEEVLTIKLPSGKKLYYWEPKMALNRWGKECVTYKGIDQKIARWTDIETYGGKLVENIVQAISRDLLADSMLRLDKEGFEIVMHVHDEAAAEVPNDQADKALKTMCDIMGKEVPWAKGLPLNAEGYVTKFYKKD